MKKIFIFLTPLFLIVLFAGIFIFQGFYSAKDPQEGAEEKIFLIERGQSLFEVSENLQREGLVKGRTLFNLYVFLKGWRLKLKAGNYELSSSMNIAEIAKKITSGDIVKEKITIIEGWNLRDIGAYFEQKGIATAEELFELAPKDFSEEFGFLTDKPKNASLEGYLFPDTYEISPGIALKEIINIMLANFNKKLTPELREEITKQNKSIFEIVTMASLLEKEVRTDADKELVAGILWKRLEGKIPLQVDATITYLTGKKTTKILKEETKIDSPYNTYKYLGLPVGPIANPGLASIKAALYPKSSDFWYYLSTPEGETVFSKTLSEHNINRNKYLR